MPHFWTAFQGLDGSSVVYLACTAYLAAWAWFVTGRAS